jgi:hypothetical protein
MRVKVCIVCGVEFTPLRNFQKVCQATCAIKYATDQRDKARAKAERIAAQESRKVIRLEKERIKTARDWIKEAQVAFNAFIRLRDSGKPCICCGKPLGENAPGGGYDCGHYRSVGSAPHLRFDERNAHAQRKQCNRYGAGRAVDYRIGLISRIGLSAVEALEADQGPRKYTIEQLKAIKAHYTAKLKELKCSAK